MRGCAREIVLVNRDRKRAEGVITDVQYGASMSPMVTLRAGDYPDLKGASLVMITIGINEKTGGATDRSDPSGRLRLLKTNAEIYRVAIAKIHAAAPEALILVVTDPPDPLAQLAGELIGHERVLSTGTFLDSLRFRWHLANHLGIDPMSVDANVVGEHGTTEVFLWSSATIGGMPIADLGITPDLSQKIESEVRYANITIIEGIGASQYGIGMVCARIAEIILRDEQTVIPIGSYQPRYQTVLSLPSIVGKKGIVKVLNPSKTAAEDKALQKSADAIRTAFNSLT
jgi:L-lactate dehydrogenase